MYCDDYFWVQTILWCFFNLSFAEFNCSRLNESLVQPVRYIKGDNEAVMNGIPPFAKSASTPGYVQFRSYSPTGIPNAFCPGVK